MNRNKSIIITIHKIKIGNMCKTHKKQLKRKIFKNLECKKDLHNMLEESEYSFTLIKKELSSRWKELWMNIEKMRFNFNPYRSIKKLQL